MDEDIELSTFTLRYKLRRHGFDFRYDEKSNLLKIGRSRTSKRFVFYWLVLPAIIFVGQMLVIQFLPSSTPLRRLDYFSYLTSFWLVISSGIVFDRKRLNKSYIEVRRNGLKIKTKQDEFNYQATEIETIEIDTSKSYEKDVALNFFGRAHLIVQTSDGKSHSIIYVFGEKMINNWDDLRYIRKHLWKILSAH